MRSRHPSSPRVWRWSLVAAAALSLMAAGGGCGEDGAPEPTPSTRFAEALRTVAGAEPLGLGYGWVDLERLGSRAAERRAALSWAANALGPGARDPVKEVGAARQVGIDVLGARAALSVATSYALALRLDGIETTRARAALARTASARSARDGWLLLDLGPEWSTPLETPLAPLGSLAARAAVRGPAIVLARSDSARDAVVSPDPAAIEATAVRSAVACLGDVVAARLVLNNHTHLPNVGPDLLAFGVSAGGGAPRDILCAVDASPETIQAAARSVRDAFEPGARDAVSGESMRTLVSDSALETFNDGDLRVARVTLSPSHGAEPGLFFSAFDRGSLLTYLGLQRPPTPGPDAGTDD